MNSSQSDISKMMDRAFGRILAGLSKGVGKAAVKLMEDAINEYPGVPLKDGRLRGSGSAFVNEKLIKTSENMGAGGTPRTEINFSRDPDVLRGTVIYDTPYAAYQHEGVRADGTHVVKNYTTAGTGKKFLETKLNKNREKYVAIVAEEIKNA